MTCTKLDATVYVHLQLEFCGLEFRALVKQKFAIGEMRFDYLGCTFQITIRADGSLSGIHAVLTGTDARLPDNFYDELVVYFVWVDCVNPQAVTTPTGVFRGADYNLPDALCRIDRDTPRAFADGTNYDNVLELFRRATNGELEPASSNTIFGGALQKH